MVGVQIPLEWAQHCSNLVTQVGLPNKGGAFEEHFLSNRKVLTFYKELILEIGDIHYFDHPAADQYVGEMIFAKRRFNFNQRLLHLPYDHPLDQSLVDLLAYDRFNDGFPLGFIIDDPKRTEEFMRLGDVVQEEFCKTIKYELGELRFYEWEHVPVFDLRMIKNIVRTLN